MLPQASKEFMARMWFFWKPMFQGRNLLLTNTITCGGMLCLGDWLQQSWEIYKGKKKARDWKRTGEEQRGSLLLPGSGTMIPVGSGPKIVEAVKVYHQERVDGRRPQLSRFLPLTLLGAELSSDRKRGQPG